MLILIFVFILLSLPYPTTSGYLPICGIVFLFYKSALTPFISHYPCNPYPLVTTKSGHFYGLDLRVPLNPPKAQLISLSIQVSSNLTSGCNLPLTFTSSLAVDLPDVILTVPMQMPRSVKFRYLLFYFKIYMHRFVNYLIN